MMISQRPPLKLLSFEEKKVGGEAIFNSAQLLLPSAADNL